MIDFFFVKSLRSLDFGTYLHILRPVNIQRIFEDKIAFLRGKLLQKKFLRFAHIYHNIVLLPWQLFIALRGRIRKLCTSVVGFSTSPNHVNPKSCDFFDKFLFITETNF